MAFNPATGQPYLAFVNASSHTPPASTYSDWGGAYLAVAAYDASSSTWAPAGQGSALPLIYDTLSMPRLRFDGSGADVDMRVLLGATCSGVAISYLAGDSPRVRGDSCPADVAYLDASSTGMPTWQSLGRPALPCPTHFSFDACHTPGYNTEYTLVDLASWRSQAFGFFLVRP